MENSTLKRYLENVKIASFVDTFVAFSKLIESYKIKNGNLFTYPLFCSDFIELIKINPILTTGLTPAYNT